MFESELDTDVQTRLSEVTSKLEQASEQHATQASRDKALIASLQDDVKASNGAAADQVALQMHSILDAGFFMPGFL